MLNIEDKNKKSISLLKTIAPVGFFIGLIIGVIIHKVSLGVFIGLILSGLLFTLGIIFDKK